MANLKDTIYRVDLANGRCGLTTARTIEAAKREVIADEGRLNFRSIRPATQDDIAWVKAMGGYVPEGRLRKERTRHD